MCGFESFAAHKPAQFTSLFQWYNISTMFSGLLVIFSVTAMATSDITSEYFPKATDLSKVTWAHAVNNKSLLQEALSSDVNMLEADVSLGKLLKSDKLEIPIMAHPPANLSDLSLKDFIMSVNSHNINNSDSHKGIKLDFKSIKAFTESVNILKANIKELKPMWLNADILPGPVNATGKPVDAEQFISVCNKQFSNITLSIGWTTNYNSSYEGEGYTVDQIDNMIKTINLLQVKHSITFPVRAGLAAESYEEMKTLIDNVTDSTLTIWSSETDPVNVKKLKALILDIGLNKVYVDVPEKLSDELDLSSAGSHADFGILPLILTMILLILSILM